MLTRNVSLKKNALSLAMNCSSKASLSPADVQAHWLVDHKTKGITKLKPLKTLFWLNYSLKNESLLSLLLN